MANPQRTPVNVTVLYAPLCGWCYGATPALRHLAEQPRFSLGLLPTGLFAGSGARPIDDQFAAFATPAADLVERDDAALDRIVPAVTGLDLA